MTKLEKDPTTGMDFVATGETKNPKSVLVMLHGSGTDYSDMEQASKFFAKKMPDTLILIPNAPYRFVDILPPEQAQQIRAAGMDEDKMRSWFEAISPLGLTESQIERALLQKIEETAVEVNYFIDAQKNERGIESLPVAVYGFSQGGVLALQAGLQAWVPYSAVVSQSGYMLDATYAISRPRTLLIVGDKETAPGLPMEGMHAVTVEIAQELGLPYTEYVAPGLGHGLNAETVNKATAFMNEALAGPKPETVAKLSEVFEAFTKPDIAVREVFREKEDGTRETLYVEQLDRNSKLMQDFRKAATDAGFRDVRVLGPTDSRFNENVTDRVTAVMKRGEDGRYRLGGFKAG